MKRYISAAIKDILEEPEYIRLGVVKDPRTTLSTLLHIAKYDTSIDVLRELAYNSQVPAEVRHYLADNQMESIRDIIARLSFTEPEVLSKLSRDPSDYVRKTVARNPNTPDEDTIWLIAQEDANIIDAVLRRSKISDEVLSAILDTDLVTSGSSTGIGICREIVKSLRWMFDIEGTCPSAELLIKLAQIHDWDVESDLITSDIDGEWKLPTEAFYILAESPNKFTLRDLGEDPNTPLDILLQLADYPVASIRRGVANSTKLPEDCYRKLALDDDDLVRSWVARNPAVPEEIVESLLNDPNERVRQHAEKRLDGEV